MMLNLGRIGVYEDFVGVLHAQLDTKIGFFAPTRSFLAMVSDVGSKSHPIGKYISPQRHVAANQVAHGCICVGLTQITASEHPVKLRWEPVALAAIPNRLDVATHPHDFRVGIGLANLSEPIWRSDGIVIEEGNDVALCN